MRTDFSATSVDRIDIIFTKQSLLNVSVVISYLITYRVSYV